MTTKTQASDLGSAVSALQAGVGYRTPRVENIEHGVRGIHAGLEEFGTLPENYRGVAIYCGWQMTAEKWETFETEFGERR